MSKGVIIKIYLHKNFKPTIHKQEEKYYGGTLIKFRESFWTLAFEFPYQQTT